MKTLPTWAAVVALGAAVTTTSSAFGQADLQLKQARERERQEKREQRQENRAEQRADRQERQQLKGEREQLNNMPEPVRRVLRAETEGASNIDYFRVPSEKKDGPAFWGATFTKAGDGHHYDIRVDRQGRIVDRTDITALHAAQAQAEAAPGQAPATPAPAPAPAPAPPPPPSARGEAPESGDPVYRRLEPNEVPANIRVVLDREAQGGEDVKYYRSKYGTQMSYTVRFEDKNGREQTAYVADDGSVLARRGQPVDDDEAQTAGASERANPSDKAIQPPDRVELNKMPRQAQTQLRRLTEGAKDAKFYRTKYGNQQAYQASFTGRDGKERRVFVDESGRILNQRQTDSN